MSFDGIPPQALDVERTVLGSMIADAPTIAVGIEMLPDDCFYMTANKIIFRAIKELFLANKPVDIITLNDTLTAKGQIEAIGDTAYLSELSGSIATLKNIPHYCEILLDKAERRKNINACHAATAALYDDLEQTASDITNKTIASFLSNTTRAKTKTVRLSDLLPAEFERIDKIEAGEWAADIETGYSTIDSVLFIKNSDLIVIGGRPSMGKTSVTDCMVRNVAFKKRRVLKINLESSNDNECERALFSEARISLHQFKSGYLPKRELPKLSLAAAPLSDAEIYLNDDPYTSPAKIHSILHRLNHEVGRVDLLVIDFLQLLNADRRYESKRIEVGELTREIKNIGKVFKVPVFLISQLSRLERGVVRAPTMSDLKESGDIEQNADAVLLLHREDYYCRKEVAKEKGVENQIDIIIAKNKNGPTGHNKMAYIKEYMRLEELAVEGPTPPHYADDF